LDGALGPRIQAVSPCRRTQSLAATKWLSDGESAGQDSGFAAAHRLVEDPSVCRWVRRHLFESSGAGSPWDRVEGRRGATEAGDHRQVKEAAGSGTTRFTRARGV